MTRLALLSCLLLTACVDQLDDAADSSELGLQRVQSFWFEAESGTLTPPMQNAGSSAASAGTYILVPTTAGSGGSASYGFTATTDANVAVWARVIAPSIGANGISVWLDTAPRTYWELPITTTWTWVKLPSPTWSVLAGSHTLQVLGEEAGVCIDRLLLTSSTSFVPIVETFQAESATLVAPMQIGSGGPMFAPTRFIWVPNGAGSNGTAQLATPVAASSYFVWGRLNAPTPNDNLFFIDGNPWDVPVTTASSWEWNRVTYDGIVPVSFGLDATSVLDLSQGEDGVKLDKLVLTNDRGFTLVEPSELVKTF